MPFNHPPPGLTSTDWRCSSTREQKKKKKGKIWAKFRAPYSVMHSSKSGLLDALSLSHQVSVLLAFPSSLLCYCMCVMPKNTLACTSKEDSQFPSAPFTLAETEKSSRPQM